MKVSTNIQSIKAQHNVEHEHRQLGIESGMLSSGDRILSSATDPSGLAISEKMKAKIRSQAQAERNINDGISLLQVAEGTLNVIHSISGRMKELAIQSANDTLSDSERYVVDKEYQSMKNEIIRLTESTRYNGNHILRDDGNSYDLQVDINGDADSRLVYNMDKVLGGIRKLEVYSTSVNSKMNSQEAIGSINDLIGSVSSSRASLGAVSNRMEKAMNNIQNGRFNTEKSNSQIRDTDFAKVSTDRAATMLKKDASIAVLAQANTTPKLAEKLVT